MMDLRNVWLVAALVSTACTQASVTETRPPTEEPSRVSEPAKPLPGPQPSAASIEAGKPPQSQGVADVVPIMPPTPAPDPVAGVLALSPSVSTSVGGPSSGELRGGVLLPETGPGFFHNPKRPRDAGFGTVELVQAIVRAAGVVEQELPGSTLTVNDLGLHEGGPIRQHGSHQAGRDADILFYVLDAQRAPIRSVGVPLDPKGKGWDFKELPDPNDDQRVQLDAPRTWRWVQALLEIAGDDVQRIFLVEHVRTLLLARAQAVGAPRAIVERFADVTCQPSAPHDDHMHVRFFCSAEDIAAGCRDSPPIYPWHSEALREVGSKPVIATAYTSKADREARAQRTTTPSEARKKAGPMHASVRRFLAEREAWIEEPHPGRTYCR